MVAPIAKAAVVVPPKVAEITPNAPVNRDEAIAEVRKHHPISATYAGPEVKDDTIELQTKLKAQGFYKGDITGTPDAALEDAVKAYQTSKGLKPDGIVGQETWGAIYGVSLPEGIEMLKPWENVSAMRDVFEGVSGGMSDDALLAKAKAIDGGAFYPKLLQVATHLGMNPPEKGALGLLKVMQNESGINPHQYNTDPSVPASAKAVGLIQFMPNTAHGLGTSSEALAAMSATDQLTYVERYFSAGKGKMNSATDIYTQTFYPAALGKPDDYVIGSEKGTKYAQVVGMQNKGFDLDKNGTITAGEFREYCAKKFGEGPAAPKPPDINPSVPLSQADLANLNAGAPLTPEQIQQGKRSKGISG